MKVPLSWLREYVDFDAEPRRLASDLTLAGLAVDGIETVGGDTVLDLDITTNRVDCMNVYGVAREVATLYGKPLKALETSLAEAGAPASESVRVTISAPDLCPRFCARVLDVAIGPSPDWLRSRLEAVGVRSISNIVDLTNYVMIEMGQPTHAFDGALIPQSTIDVRWARPNETLTTLDGADRTLQPNHGVVAGPKEALALAGIMGGVSSEVSDSTRHIVLEAAYWVPIAIRRGSKSLGMHTEASHRFERGADPEAPPIALDRIAHLLGRIGAGTARPGVIDVVAVKRQALRLVLRYAQVERVLGMAVEREQCDRILQALGFRHVEDGAARGTFEVPSWRSDVSREVDLIEEVARHVGLGALPTTFSVARISSGLKREQSRERLVRDVLVGAGYTENINYAFVSSKGSAPYGVSTVVLENPLSEDRDVLRASLVFPGLLANLETNLRHDRKDVQLFEIGHVFRPTGDRPAERLRLAFVCTGSPRRNHWSEKPRAADFFDGKGLVELLLQTLAVESTGIEASPVRPFLHPGKAVTVTVGDDAIGYVGVLHPDLASPFGVKSDIVVGEIDIEALLVAPSAGHPVEPLPRFPAVSRDLSLMTDASRPAAGWLAETRRAGGTLLTDAFVSDRYEGPPLPTGKVSLTLRLRYRHPDRTLTGGEIQESVAAIVAALSRGGADIRGEG